MPLQVQGARSLSDLEKDAVRLVFGDSINPDAEDPDDIDQRMTVEVAEEIISGGSGVAGSYGGNGRVKISRLMHQFAEDLDGDTTVDDIDLTIPNNIKYLATLVHETGHHWQRVYDRYDNRVPEYEFNNEVLEDLDFECKEQHASVGQVYFILKWQLHHGHDPIDITQSAFLQKNVGPVDRYEPIVDIPHNNNKRFIDPPEAIPFVNNFNEYLDDLL